MSVITKLDELAHRRARDFSAAELRVLAMLPARDVREFESGRFAEFMTGAMMATLLISKGADLSSLVDKARVIWSERPGGTPFENICDEWL